MPKQIGNATTANGTAHAMMRMRMGNDHIQKNVNVKNKITCQVLINWRALT